MECELCGSLHEAVVSELHALLAEARAQRDKATEELLDTTRAAKNGKGVMKAGG